MDAEEEDSNENETFQEDTVVIEVQETPELAVWMVTEEMNSHSLEEEELQIENWIESG